MPRTVCAQCETELEKYIKWNGSIYYRVDHHYKKVALATNYLVSEFKSNFRFYFKYSHDLIISRCSDFQSEWKQNQSLPQFELLMKILKIHLKIH